MNINPALENKLIKIKDELGVSKEDRATIRSNLLTIALFDEQLYEHSLRVGILSVEIGKKVGADGLTDLLKGAISHDIGKTKLQVYLFRKGPVNDSEFEKIKEHTSLGYEILKHGQLYSAYIALRHHYFGDEPYPEMQPDMILGEDQRRTVDRSILITSIADFYDAAKTRKYKKFDLDLQNNGVLRNLLKEHYSMHKQVIDKLFDGQVLG